MELKPLRGTVERLPGGSGYVVRWMVHGGSPSETHGEEHLAAANKQEAVVALRALVKQAVDECTRARDAHVAAEADTALRQAFHASISRMTGLAHSLAMYSDDPRDWDEIRRNMEHSRRVRERQAARAARRNGGGDTRSGE